MKQQSVAFLAPLVALPPAQRVSLDEAGMDERDD